MTVNSASAVDIADALLLGVCRRKAGAVLIEPVAGSHVISLSRPGGAVDVGRLPGALGDATIARLGVLAGLDVMVAEQVGRVAVRIGDAERHVFVSISNGAAGLSAELRHLSGGESAVLPGGLAGAFDAEEGEAPSRIGSYTIRGELGRGGTSIVYLGEHEVLRREVAIKILSNDAAREPATASRFVREARAASRARHPGIVEIIDFGTLTDGRTYLVMERILGRTLEAVMDQGALDPARAVAIVRQIAIALDAAHEIGIVHRDVKPANVFVLDESGVDPVIKVVDFGAAKVTDPARPWMPSESQRGQIFGTPHYMSPEHARGGQTDKRSDVYSLGCVLFELLTGQVPFNADTAVEILTMQITTPPPPLVSPHGPLPEALEEVVARALAKRPEERYGSAQEMASDLKRVSLLLHKGGWRRWLPL